MNVKKRKNRVSEDEDASAFLVITLRVALQ